MAVTSRHGVLFKNSFIVSLQNQSIVDALKKNLMIVGACGERGEEQMRLYFLNLKRMPTRKEKRVLDHRWYEKYWSILSVSL